MLKRCIGRVRHLRGQEALVLVGSELGFGAGIEEIDAAKHDDGKDQRHRHGVQATVQHAHIGPMDFRKATVDEVGDTFFPATAVGQMRLQDARAHHWRQRQRNDHGHGNGADKREGELREQRARQAALETDRNVDGDQHHRHGQDRPHQLMRRVQRRPHGRRSLFDMTVDVLHHDDGIVDDEADRQNQGKQRQKIDREAEDQHHRESADQRQRYGDDGDGDRSRRTEKGENHENDDRESFDQLFTTSSMEVVTKVLES